MNKRSLRDLGLFLALALALLAATPFLVRPGLPRDTDAELHVFRAAEIAACWRAGVLYPRWAPDLYYGFGYPIFNYYAPLSYYLANLFALLPGVGVVEGVKGVFVLALLLGGVGTYLLVRDLVGPEGGVVGAASFLFAPYVVFIDPHARGDLAEHLAVGLLPLALFFLRRLVARGGWGALVGASVSTAALVLSHNLLGVVGLAVLLAALVWQALAEGQRKRAWQGGLALVLGLAISAFFWLPMLMELGDVQLSVVGAGHFDFHNHFVSLGELLAPSRILDWGTVAPRYWRNLGAAQWLLALVGVGALVKPGPRRLLLFFLLVGVGLTALITPASSFLWEALPVLAYLQFPWRLLGPAALAWAVCGSGLAALLPVRVKPVVLAGAVLAVLLAALPQMFPFSWGPSFGDTSPAGSVRFELEGKAVGTTSTGDFLPRTVEIFLRPQPSLTDSYEGPGPVDKVNRAVLPEGTTVDIVDRGPVHDRFRVSGEHSFVFRLYTLLFPGWHAYVDGQEVPIAPGKPEGFITFMVPSGEYEVLVRFEDTRPRRLSWWLTGIGLLGVGLAAMLVRRPAGDVEGRASLSKGGLAWLGGALLLFVVFRVALVGPHDRWFRYTSPPGEAWAAQYVQHAVLGDQIELLGFDLPRRSVRAGETLPVVLYWRALRPLDVNYQSFVHLMTDPASVSWGQSDALNPGGLPTERWPLDRYVWDTHQVVVRPETPPGEYGLQVGLYTLGDGQRLSVIGPDGTAVGQSVTLNVPIQVLEVGSKK